MTENTSSIGPRAGSAAPAAPSLRPAEICYVLFRHKWLVAGLSLLGIVAAVALLVVSKPVYTSEAKLLVRYVRDTRAADAAPGAVQGDLRSPDRGGESLINSELEILSSRDLAAQVAELVGPEQIVGAGPGATNVNVAAHVLMLGLQLEVPRRSAVILVRYSHRNPEVAQKVVRQLIQSYLRKHAEVHRAVGLYDDVLTRKTDEWRMRLSETEDALQKVKLGANVTTVEESRKVFTDQAARLRQDLIVAEADLAQRRTFLERIAARGATPAPETTNAEPAAPLPSPLAPETEKHYRYVCARLESLRNRELELGLHFSAESPLVREVRDQIAEVERSKQQLEAEEPRLVAPALVQARSAAPAGRAFGIVGEPVDLLAEQAQVVALEAKARVLREYLDRAQTQITNLVAAEKSINDLERNRALQETNYRYFSVRLDQARVDEAIGTANLFDNINVVQDATVAIRARSATHKITFAILLAGVGAGFVLPLLLEFLLNQRIRRPDDVEQKLRLPLYLSIPDFGRNGNGQRQLRAPRLIAETASPSHGTAQPESVSQVEAVAKADTAAGDTANEAVDVVVGNAMPMDAYHEALRDRLIMHFELAGLTHKPKLVAVTGTHHGSGVSVLAGGLAQSLSETGEGSVLLVDMNTDRGPSVHPFYRGKAAVGLTEAFQQDTRPLALVHDNLYVVSLHGNNGRKVGIVPRKFANLMPTMKASDYDYIIFDMPPVSQTSVTAKVCGLMDMTFLVVESERTKEEQAKRCTALLAESRAKVGVILNRYHNYLPARLQTDI